MGVSSDYNLLKTHRSIDFCLVYWLIDPWEEDRPHEFMSVNTNILQNFFILEGKVDLSLFSLEIPGWKQTISYSLFHQNDLLAFSSSGHPGAPTNTVPTYLFLTTGLSFEEPLTAALWSFTQPQLMFYSFHINHSYKSLNLFLLKYRFTFF